MPYKPSVWIALCGMAVAACSASHSLDKGRDFHLTPISYSALQGWQDDDFKQALPAIQQSCQTPLPTYRSFCKGLEEYKYASSDSIRLYIEKTLKPYAVTSRGQSTGIITGYYEAELTGTREKRDDAQIPIYGKPAGHIKDKKIHTREQIESREYNAPIIAWADDPVDMFILQVQGSGRLITPYGEEIKLGYAGNNGHPFTGLGTILEKEGVPANQRNSMPNIKKWLQDNPRRARELMAKNKRFIFFAEMQGESPYGTGGVVLTPMRSVAVDQDYIPMHTMMWLETTNPNKGKLNHMVVAQDSGNAIKGGIRADYFWGHGDEAFQNAGCMKSQGRYFLLLPD